MENIDSFWTFHESVDELKQQLEITTYELEITRKETNEEIRKNNEHIKKLLQLLQTTCKERDEAKTQLKKLQQIMAFYNNPNNVIDHHTIIPTTISSAPFSPDSPLLTNNNNNFPTKANSSITESSSFSLETYTNHNNNNNSNINSHPQSHVSSPVIDSTSSPDSSYNNIGFNAPNVTNSVTKVIVDQESLIIASLAKGRPLPPKGKLLQAVIEAGPLLSTLMVAGSLPQWRNPPGVLTHQIPPVNLKGSVGVVSHNNNKHNVVVPDFVSPSPTCFGKGYSGHFTSSGSLEINPGPMMDFGSGSSGSCFMGGRMMMNSCVSFDCQISKRQRLV